MIVATKAPTSGATKKTQTCERAVLLVVEMAKTMAGANERAGLTEVPVSGIPIK